MTLPKVREVRADLEPALRSRQADSETSDHLIEDQQAAVGVADLAQPAEEVRPGTHHAHVRGNGLHDDGRDLVRGIDEDGLHRVQVVERDDDGVGHCRSRDPVRAGDPQRGHAGAGRRQHGVGMTVIAALELQDLVPAGGAAREAQDTHHRLGAGV